eukprot:g5627.t1
MAPLMVVFLGRLAASATTSRCVGEYALDPATGECDLVSNYNHALRAFDADEPTATHASCGRGAFRCPAGHCVASAAAYAACATGRPAPARHGGSGAPPAPALRAARGGRCNVTGSWECGGVRGALAMDGALARFNATAVDAPPGFAWTAGEGAVAADGATVRMFYPRTAPSGRPQWRAGVLSADCASIAWNDSSTWTCDYDGAGASGSCPAPAPLPPVLDVHIVCHTHDDTGYLSTVDEYFDSNVRSILDTVTRELQRNPARKFTYVEIAFFEKWWAQQGEGTRAAVRRLVAEGQLDFSQGGWCMPDEGATHYADLFANAQRGMRFLVREFGAEHRPRVGWSVDPFGHSHAYGAMQAQLGLHAFVVGRIDFQEKAARFATRAMETVWRPRGPAANRSRYDVLTHVLDPIQFYGYPPGFNFEGDAQARVTDANVEARAADFHAFVLRKAAGYATDSLMVPFGSDFQFTNASYNYESLDRLMAHVNADQQRYGMRLRYSTPALYFDALHAKRKADWPLKTDDFESYAIGPDQFLVGFYSSRPDYKGMIRALSAQLRAANAALAMARVRLRLPARPAAASHDRAANLSIAAELAQLDVQGRALGVAQHHDAITSSQRRHVHRDYIAQLSVGQTAVDGTTARVVAALLGGASLPVPPALTTCPYLNESACAATAGAAAGDALVIALNPMARARPAAHFRVPVSNASLGGAGANSSLWVADRATGLPVVSQVLPPWPAAPHQHDWATFVEPAPTVAWNGALRGHGTASWALRWGASSAAAGTPGAGVPSSFVSSARAHVAGQAVVLENAALRAEFDPQTAMLARLTRKGAGGAADVTVAVAHSLRYYVASDGTTGPYARQGAQGSGNYIFEPTNGTTFAVQASPAPVDPVIVRGPVVSEVRHVLQSTVHGKVELAYRLHADAGAEGADTLEVVYRVGPVDVSDGQGKEIVARFDTDLRSGDAWASDSNGLELVRRRRDARATLWPGGPAYFNQTDIVAGNYFAANTLATLQDGADAGVGGGRERSMGGAAGRRLSVLLDRSQGCASLASGQLELMLHRRLTHGCRWGMCEAGADGTMEKAGLNDTLGAEVVLKHRLAVDGIVSAPADAGAGASDSLARLRVRELGNPPAMLFGSTGNGSAAAAVPTFAPYANESALPPSLELTTLQLADDGALLVLRVTHIFPPREHPALSVPASVDLCALFGPDTCARWEAPVEMAAAADVPLASVQRLQWQAKGDPPRDGPARPAAGAAATAAGDANAITVQPGDTRTFTLRLL